jgi:hypothetical protein
LPLFAVIHTNPYSDLGTASIVREVIKYSPNKQQASMCQALMARNNADVPLQNLWPPNEATLIKPGTYSLPITPTLKLHSNGHSAVFPPDPLEHFHYSWQVLQPSLIIALSLRVSIYIDLVNDWENSVEETRQSQCISNTPELAPASRETSAATGNSQGFCGCRR